MSYSDEIVDKTTVSDDIIFDDEIESKKDKKENIVISLAEGSEGISKIEKSPETKQSLTSFTNSSPILTTGRTKRYLQEKKLVRDSPKLSAHDTQGPWSTIDCVFCNFPWGENIFEYFNETENILKVLGEKLNTGCECAFITKQLISKNVLESSGFLLREIIPIGDDAAVKSRKKGQGQGQGQDRPYLKTNKESNNSYRNGELKANTGDCFITFATVM